jgi:hypothetical protein
MLFSRSILATLLPASPASSSKCAPLCVHFYPAGDGSIAIFANALVPKSAIPISIVTARLIAVRQRLPLEKPISVNRKERLTFIALTPSMRVYVRMW